MRGWPLKPPTRPGEVFATEFATEFATDRFNLLPTNSRAGSTFSKNCFPHPRHRAKTGSPTTNQVRSVSLDVFAVGTVVGIGMKTHDGLFRSTFLRWALSWTIWLAAQGGSFCPKIPHSREGLYTDALESV